MAYKKSSYSATNGNCVEVDLLFRTVSQDKDGKVIPGRSQAIAVRDTKDKGEGAVLQFTPNEWNAFVAGVKRGEFDIPRR